MSKLILVLIIVLILAGVSIITLIMQQCCWRVAELVIEPQCNRWCQGLCESSNINSGEPPSWKSIKITYRESDYQCSDIVPCKCGK